MFQVTVLLFSTFVTCFGDIPVTPPSPSPPRVLCGEIPNNIFACLGKPSVFSFGGVQSCSGSTNSCDKITCLFRSSGYLEGNAVNKTKVIEVVDRYAEEHPEWSAAVQHAKAACLAADLPAQGYFLGCPAYDIVTCSMASFIKNAQPSQWSTSPKCENPRQYAGSCPVCPQECFAPSIPIGSCNACYALPRSP